MKCVVKLRHLFIEPRKVEDLSETPRAPKSLNRISAQTAKPFGVKQRIPVWVKKPSAFRRHAGRLWPREGAGRGVAIKSDCVSSLPR